MFILLYYLVLVQVLGVEFSAPAVSTLCIETDAMDAQYWVHKYFEYWSMIQTRGLQYWCLGYCMHTWYY